MGVRFSHAAHGPKREANTQLEQGLHVSCSLCSLCSLCTTKMGVRFSRAAHAPKRDAKHTA